MPKNLIGNDYKAYYGDEIALGSDGILSEQEVQAHQWTQITCKIQSVNINRTKNVIQDAGRCSTSQRVGSATKGFDLTFTMPVADPFYEFLIDAFDSNQTIAFAEVQGDITGTIIPNGVAFNADISVLSQSHPVNGIVTVSVTLVPIDIQDQWVQMAIS